MELLSSETARWIFAAWFLFVGGAVGSFLNVVVYRLPAGMNISWPGSHCPRCKHAIRAYDNIPVLAWLWLRGRCRDCRQPISFRYPLVEAVTAGLFLLLLVVEVFHGGENCLPVRRRASRLSARGSPLPLPVPSGPALYADGRRAHSMGRQAADALALRAAAGGRAGRTADLALAASPGGMPGGGGNALGRRWSIACWGSEPGCSGPNRRMAGQRFTAIGRPGHQILGEALVIGVVLGWQAVVVLVPLAMLLEELSRIARVRWRSARRFVAAVWLAPLALVWILIWARLAAWLQLG